MFCTAVLTFCGFTCHVWIICKQLAVISKLTNEFAFICKGATIEFKKVIGLKLDCTFCSARAPFLIWIDSLPLRQSNFHLSNLKKWKVTISHTWAESASISTSEEMYHEPDQQSQDLMCDRFFVCLYKTAGPWVVAMQWRMPCPRSSL